MRIQHGSPLAVCFALLLLPAAWISTWLAAGQPAHIETEYLTSFQLRDTTLSQAEFTWHYRRHGAVMLHFDPSPSILEDAFPALDRYLEAENITRIKMSSDDNVSANPDNVSTGVSPLRMRFRDHATLAPADDTVQGPHQEGASASRGNRRAIVFLCEEPAAENGGTALFDMQRAWEVLPADLQARLAGANFGFRQHDGSLLVVPAVVLHDVTGKPCLQFYCFGRTRRDCVDVYRHRTGRYHVRPDPYQYEMHADADLMLKEAGGAWRPFVGLDVYRMLDSVYSAMIAHTWSKGQALVVDNIRWAHARLDGAGPRRKLHFFYYGPRDWSFSLNKLPRPQLSTGGVVGE
mmetsp:Transcript_4525/g.9215  ORF Transcript_4525/g.9215 Transcript_4525/m.9215 type:complete len:348 (+) Transcript_4525:84-1127(+)